jgi:hypothetical protein
VKKVREASLEEVASVVGKSKAELVLKYFRTQQENQTTS